MAWSSSGTPAPRVVRRRADDPSQQEHPGQAGVGVADRLVRDGGKKSASRKVGGSTAKRSVLSKKKAVPVVKKAPSTTTIKKAAPTAKKAGSVATKKAPAKKAPAPAAKKAAPAKKAPRPLRPRRRPLRPRRPSDGSGQEGGGREDAGQEGGGERQRRRGGGGRPAAPPSPRSRSPRHRCDRRPVPTPRTSSSSRKCATC